LSGRRRPRWRRPVHRYNNPYEWPGVSKVIPFTDTGL
jgi:hypothetical protein